MFVTTSRVNKTVFEFLLSKSGLRMASARFLSVKFGNLLVPI